MLLLKSCIRRCLNYAINVTNKDSFIKINMLSDELFLSVLTMRPIAINGLFAKPSIYPIIIIFQMTYARLKHLRSCFEKRYRIAPSNQRGYDSEVNCFSYLHCCLLLKLFWHPVVGLNDST